MERKAALLQRKHSTGAAAQIKAVLYAVGLICFCSALLTGLYVAQLASGRATIQEQASYAGSSLVKPAASAMHVAWLTQQLPAQQEQVLQLEAASSARQERKELEGAAIQDGVDNVADIAGAEQHGRTGQIRQHPHNSGMQRHGQHDDFVVVLAVNNGTHAHLEATQQLWQVCDSPLPLSICRTLHAGLLSSRSRM